MTYPEWRKVKTIYIERGRKLYPVWTEYVRISPSRLVVKSLCIVALVAAALAVALAFK